MTPDPTACSVARTINGGARHRYRQTCSRADCYAAAVRPAFRDPRARLSINPITSVTRTRRPSGHVERNERAVVLADLARRRRNRPRRVLPAVARCRLWPWRCGAWPARRSASIQFPVMTLQHHPGSAPRVGQPLEGDGSTRDHHGDLSAGVLSWSINRFMTTADLPARRRCPRGRIGGASAPPPRRRPQGPWPKLSNCRSSPRKRPIEIAQDRWGRALANNPLTPHMTRLGPEIGPSRPSQ